MKMRNQFLSLEVVSWGNETVSRVDYDISKHMWVEDERGGYSKWFRSGFPCRSYKAALRHIRKHDEIPIGTTFVLWNRWCGFNRCLTKK